MVFSLPIFGIFPRWVRTRKLLIMVLFAMFEHLGQRIAIFQGGQINTRKEPDMELTTGPKSNDKSNQRDDNDNPMSWTFPYGPDHLDHRHRQCNQADISEQNAICFKLIQSLCQREVALAEQAPAAKSDLLLEIEY